MQIYFLIVFNILSYYFKISHFLLFIICFADADHIDGLLFNSIYDVSKEYKEVTSLKIPSDNVISFKNNIRLEFDIFLWKKNPFGFIVSAGNDTDPHVFVLSYSDYKSKDTSYIELTYKDRPSIISIPVLDKDQGWRKWKKVVLYFEIENQRIGLSFDDQNIIWYKEKTPIPNKMQFHFGGTSFVVEPPRMAIKKIIFNRDNNETISWPLDENNGAIVHSNYDNGNSWDGSVTNGTWIKELHTRWNKIHTQRIYKNKFKFIGNDIENNYVIYLLGDSLYHYDINKKEISEVFPFSYLPNDNYLYHYNPITKKVFAMHGGGGSRISSYNKKTNSWDNFMDNFESDGLYYTSNILHNYQNGDTYSLGGYGWYEQKNILQKYNDQSFKWDKTKYKIKNGENFFPRCKSSLVFDQETGNYYLYGGQGNESGKQQQGFRRLNDLWLIDINNLEFNQLWIDSTQIVEDYKSNFQKIALSSKHKTIFKILSDNRDNENLNLYVNNTTKMAVSSFESRNFEYFDVQLSSNINEMNNVNIVHFESLDFRDELLIVVLNKKEDKDYLEFYTIHLPIIRLTNYEKNYARFIIIAIILLAVCGFFFNKNQNYVEESPHPIDLINNKKTQHIDISQYILDKGITISLLNGFKIWKNGNLLDSKEWKSAKARELFIYIVINGINGVSINKIHDLFWPNVNLESARNSRAVAISRIRKIIAPYEYLLISDNEKIKFINDKELFIDFRNMIKILERPFTIESKSLDDPIMIYGKDGLLPNMNLNWVKSFRLELYNKINRYAKEYGEVLILNKNWDKLEWIGNQMLYWNEFDDFGMRYVVFANKMNKKEAMSFKIYNDFSENYTTKMKEKYSIPYKNIIDFNIKESL